MEMRAITSIGGASSSWLPPGPVSVSLPLSLAAMGVVAS